MLKYIMRQLWVMIVCMIWEVYPFIMLYIHCFPSDKYDFVIADYLTTAISHNDAYEFDRLVPLKNSDYET